MASIKSFRNTIVCILTLQVVFIILYAIFTKYHHDADAITPKEQVNESHVNDFYPMFQDVHVMIFIGFGFLMTFLKKYGFSSLGFTFLIAAIVVQWGILCYGFFRMGPDGKISISLTSLITADIIAAAILISFGAVLGKISPLQLVIMGILETVIFSVNEYIGTEIFKAVDAGGSMYVHVFGAYFGLTVSFVLSRGVSATTEEGSKYESSNYQSDITAMIGTIFLWLFWPSFNGALLMGDDRHRALLNTYLSLAGSCVTAFAVSSLFNKASKFEMVHIQNATLAGGVCIGTAADMMVQPYGALIIGSIAGVLSTLGYQFIQGFLLRTLRIHDTCGVNNLHGMPGIAAGFIGAIMAGLADESTYGVSLYENFPARTPINNSDKYWEISESTHLLPGLGRSAGQQAGYQLLALGVTFVVASTGGILTGILLKLITNEAVPPDQYYRDVYYWELEEEDDEEAPPRPGTLENSGEANGDVATSSPSPDTKFDISSL